MSTSVTPTPTTPAGATQAVVKTNAAGVTAASGASQRAVRSADGDYKVRSAATAQTRDADGDYKPGASVAAATSTSAVMTAVTSLSKGG